MARKVPNDVQKVFDQYTTNFVRRLNKDTAVQMLQKEFKLDDERATLMFDAFDEERSGVLSAWKFYHFYTAFGYDANHYLDKYCELSQNGTTTVDISGLFDFLKELKTMSGRNFTDEELETTIMHIAGQEERSVDRKKFIELIRRIKLTRN